MTALQFVLAMAAVFTLSLGLTRLVRHYAIRRMLLDIPNHRSSHSTPTPRGGGLAIVATWTVVLLACWLTGAIPSRVAAALACAVLIAIIGWWDDVKSLPARHRLVAQLTAAALAIALLGQLPVHWSWNSYDFSWLVAVFIVFGI